MTIVTNNMTQGCIDGMGQGPGSGLVPAGITTVTQGNPDEKVTAQTGSDIVYDAANGEFYIEDGAGIGGSEWRALA